MPGGIPLFGIWSFIKKHGEMALKGKAAGQKIQEPSRHYYSDFKETFFTTIIFWFHFICIYSRLGHTG